MRVFFNAIVVQIVLNAYVLWRGWHALPPKKMTRIPLLAVFTIEFVIYLIGFFFSDKLGMPYIHYAAWVGTAWMVFILYMSALLLSYDVLYFLKKRYKRIPHIGLGQKRARTLYYTLSLIIVLMSMSIGYYNFKHPTVTHKVVDLQKKCKIDKLRIVMASDLHAGYLIKKDIISMYVDKIMEQKPDVILLVGDIIDFDIAAVKEQNMQDEFRRLKAPYGVYAVTGNHEYIGIEGEEFHEKITWQSDHAGLTMLRDSVVLVDSAFYLVGREDDKYRFRKTLEELVVGIDTSYPVILMNHEPHDIAEGANNGVDLSFYGHTHNGQFFPNNLIVKFIWELPFGYKQIEDSHVYVSSGLGLAGPQFRIGTVSEIVVFDVNFNK